MLSVARMPFLVMLSGSDVRVKERIEAEKSYVRRLMRELTKARQAATGAAPLPLVPLACLRACLELGFLCGISGARVPQLGFAASVLLQLLVCLLFVVCRRLLGPLFAYFVLFACLFICLSRDRVSVFLFVCSLAVCFMFVCLFL